MTTLLISIDVEEHFDITWIADQVKTRGLTCTFFLDVFASLGEAGETVRPAAGTAARHGLDVQLHTHTGHLDFKHGMSGCSMAEQRQIIADGVDRLKEWTGVAATWHRSGDMLADKTTLSACREEGLVGDSSFVYGWPECAGLDVSERHRNSPQRISGVLELPVTTFLTIPFSRNYRHYDLDACTLPELRAVAAKAVEAGQEFLVMLAHSTSFFRFTGNGYVPDAAKRGMTIEFLDAVSGMDGLEVSDYRAIRPSGGPRGGTAESTDLCVGPALTYRRAWLHFNRSIKHKLVALAPFFVLAALAAICWWVCNG